MLISPAIPAPGSRGTLASRGLVLGWLAVATILAATTPASAAAPNFKMLPASLPRDAASVESRVRVVDLLGDAKPELAAIRRGRLSIFTLKGSAYSLAQELAVPHPPGDSSDSARAFYAFGRLSRDSTRRSLLVMGSQGVWAIPPDGTGAALHPESMAQLVKAPLIQPSVSARNAGAPGAWLAPFDFAVDLDNDGLDELLLPQSEGFTIMRQVEPGRFVPAPLPREAFTRESAIDLRRDDPEEYLRAPTWTGSTRRRVGVENLLLYDANSDGLVDLIYTKVGPGPEPGSEIERYDVFLQRKGMAFEQKPSQSMLVPYDSRADITFRDLNRDGRLDLISVRSNLDLANPRTVTRFFLAGQKEQYFTRETDRLLTKDPIGLVRLGDFTGQGNVDIAATFFSYQVGSAEDIIDLALANKVRFKVLFFRGRGTAGYDHAPSAEKELVLNLKPEQYQGFPPFYLPGDLNGDGAADLVARLSETRLAIYPSSGPLSFPAEPTQAIDVPDDAVADFDDLNGDGLLDLLVSSVSKGSLAVFLSTAR